MKRFAFLALAVLALALGALIVADAASVPGEEVLVAFAADAMQLDLVAETAAALTLDRSETITTDATSAPSSGEGVFSMGDRPAGFDIQKEPWMRGT